MSVKYVTIGQRRREKEESRKQKIRKERKQEQ